MVASMARLAAASILMCGVSLPGLLLAAELDVCGVRIPVDTVEAIDARSSKITLFGESRIIATEGLPAYVLDGYEEHPERLPVGKADLVVANCLSSGQIRLAQTALSTLLQQRPLDLESTKLLFRKLSPVTSLGELIVGTLAHRQALSLPPEAIVLLLSSLPQRDIEKVRALSDVYGTWGDEVRATIAEGQIGMLEGEQYEEAHRLVSSMRTMYGANDPVVVRMQRLQQQVLEAREAAQAGQASQVDALVRAHDAGRLGALFQMFRMRALHKAAETQVINGQVEDALRTLARIEISKRTPTTHALALRALEALPPHPQNVVVDVAVDLFLRAIAPFDEKLKQAYVTLGQRQVALLVAAGQANAATSLVEVLVSLRPEDAAWASTVRFEHAQHLLSAGDTQAARSLLSQIPQLSFLQRLRLFLQGYFRSWLLGVGALLLLAVSAALFLLRRRSLLDVPPPGPPPADVSPPDMQDLPQFRRQQKESSWDPILVSCLEALGLEPGADLHEVKSAYRAAVKEYHPDVQSEHQGLASQRFLQITKAYETILTFVEDGKIVQRRRE